MYYQIKLQTFISTCKHIVVYAVHVFQWLTDIICISMIMQHYFAFSAITLLFGKIPKVLVLNNVDAACSKWYLTTIGPDNTWNILCLIVRSI